MPSVISISIHFTTGSAVFEVSMLVLTLTPFLTFSTNSINLYLLTIYYVLGTLLGFEVTMIKDKVLTVLKFCCWEREVYRKMQTPIFEKHLENSEDRK